MTIIQLLSVAQQNQTQFWNPCLMHVSERGELMVIIDKHPAQAIVQPIVFCSIKAE